MAEEKKTRSQAVMEERKANTARLTAELEASGYHAEDATVSVLKANVMAFVTALPFCIVFHVLFCMLHPEGLRSFSGSSDTLLMTGLMLLSIPVHEGLHGLGWVGSCQNGWKSIQFGVMWSSLTPYCHCREALSVVQYYIGLLMPFTVLGLIPSAVSLFTGNVFLYLFGVYNLLIAGGDTTIGCIIAKYLGKDVKILDHPDQCGAAAFVK